MLPVIHLQEVVALWQARAKRLLEYADPADYDALWMQLRRYAEDRAVLAEERGRPVAGRQWWLLVDAMGFERGGEMPPFARALTTAELHVRRALEAGREVNLRGYAEAKANEAGDAAVARQWRLLAEAVDAPEMHDLPSEAVLEKREQRLMRTRKTEKET